MLNKSPLFAVKSKSATSSSICIYAIGSPPTGASAGSSCIPVLSTSSAYLCSKPSSSIEQSIPFDSCPLTIPFFITLGLSSFSIMPPALTVTPGSTAPSNATITFSPLRTFGAPHTIFKISFPTSTLHTCKWSESGCISHSLTSPITSFVASKSFPA